jgi:hypothetical protein
MRKDRKAESDNAEDRRCAIVIVDRRTFARGAQTACCEINVVFLALAACTRLAGKLKTSLRQRKA